MCLVLDVMHIFRTLVLDSSKWILSLVSSRKATLAKYYSGKTVLITGASSGLGKEFALQLMRLSVSESTTSPINIILSARSQQSLDQVARACRELSSASKVVVIPLDLSTLTERRNVDEYISVLNQKLKENGLAGVDCVINNAGVSSRGMALETDQASLDMVMQINFFGPVALTKALLPDMIQRGCGGAVAVVSSVQGRLGIPLRTSYAASKHAVQGYFDSLRGEISKSGISTTLISPGYIRTSLSLNAVTGDGTKYGKTDETTKSGMDPGFAAKESLLAIAEGTTDFILAEGKVLAAIQAKAQFPALLAKMTSKRMK
jgi:short-subunit dehydrogenase